jgi:uncharacterized protein YyaL (SSP411 family)
MTRAVPNRLAGQTSPYLRQHADNPVDWFPWAEEAFEQARRLDRPILLSIGYSSCHWCHVMAHESFEDADTAAVMNDRFVNIKVDREERPDIDAIYMEAVQALTGSGGWPMTVFLVPDGRPFLAGTYFPKESGRGLPSFRQVLDAVSEAWDQRRPDLLAQADQLVEAVASRASLPERSEGGPAGQEDELLSAAYGSLRNLFDPEGGGFGRAPKFPQPAMVDLLLRAYVHNRSPETLAMVSTTLDAMASGGIYDHLGGGFSRYSVDRQWLVPHFEKMLYDQAGLVRIYLHAWQVTGRRRWRQVVEETVGYVLRDLRSPGGGFCSAEDADSEGEEGRFYVWKREELFRALGPDAEQAAAWWGVTERGNFEGSNILHRARRGDLLRPPGVERSRRRLFEIRQGRVRPGLDDKVLTEWNAMFIASLVEAAAALGRSDWLLAAEEASEFLLWALRRPDGRWLRSWQGGRADHLAYAADYAWLVEALVRLYEATGSRRWLGLATEGAEDLIRLFWDPADHGLFTTGSDAETLVVRAKDFLDGATPAANSVGALALARLGALAQRPDLSEKARQIIERALGVAHQHPGAFSHLLGAVDLLGATVEIVVPGRHPELLEEVQRRFLPSAVLAWGEPGEGHLWEQRQEGWAYVCRGYACLEPASDPVRLGEQLEGL